MEVNGLTNYFFHVQVAKLCCVCRCKVLYIIVVTLCINKPLFWHKSIHFLRFIYGRTNVRSIEILLWFWIYSYYPRKMINILTEKWKHITLWSLQIWDVSLVLLVLYSSRVLLLTLVFKNGLLFFLFIAFQLSIFVDSLK